MQYLTTSEADTMAFGRALGECLNVGDVVLLSGELGAGKSVLARGIGGALGVAGVMKSPTFTLMIPHEGDKKLYHFDLYRLTEPEEFYQAGLDEFIGDDGVAVVEWAELAELGGNVSIKLEHGDSYDERRIELTADREYPALDRWRRL